MVHESPWSRPVITAQALGFALLAKYQARSVGEVRSANKIMSDLLRAFWLRELTGVTFSGLLRDLAAILRGIAVQREHPGFALVEREEETSPAVERRPDGGRINLKVRILLPADPAH